MAASRSPSRARPAARAHAHRLDAVFQAYADRGVFRGFSALDGPRGSREYRFTWLTRRPMRVTASEGRRTLTFVELFPAVADTHGLASALRRELAAHATRAVPAHRRVDPRQATMAARLANGGLSIRVTWPGRDGAPVVRALLSVVNDLFQYLHECYPDYLAAHFGMPDE